MLVWFDFLPCPFCFYEEENAYFDERRMRFLLFSVTLFIAFTMCSHWMVLVLSDEMPGVFQLTALCWVKEYFPGVVWALNMLCLICILNLPELYQPHERGHSLLSDSTVFIYIILLLTGLMAQSLKWICRKKAWLTDTCNPFQWAWTGGNYWIVLLMLSIELIKIYFYFLS